MAVRLSYKAGLSGHVPLDRRPASLIHRKPEDHRYRPQPTGLPESCFRPSSDGQASGHTGQSEATPSIGPGIMHVAESARML